MNPTRFLSLVAVASAGILFVGCAAHTNLTPLGEGRLAPHVGIGGPIVEAFETHIPVPYLMAGVDYGVRDNVNLNGGVHLLSLAYGVAGVEIGAAWFPLENEGWQPTLGVGPRLFAFASTKGGVDDRFLVYPALSASAAWNAGPRMLYAGADLAVPLSRPEYDEEAKSVILSPFLGVRWNVGKRLALLTELKWHGANIQTEKVVTGYTSIGRNGAVTPLIAIQRRF